MPENYHAPIDLSQSEEPAPDEHHDEFYEDVAPFPVRNALQIVALLVFLTLLAAILVFVVLPSVDYWLNPPLPPPLPPASFA